LRELLTLVVDQPEAGTYFLPVPADDAGDAETSRPAAFWAIEDGTFDLVRVDTATGDVLRRVAGWGPLSPEEDELGGQALVGVDAGPGEVVWVSDCCEPAIGGLFGIGPDTAGIDDPAASAFGVWPQISPDGRLVAMGILEQGVQISDAGTGEVVIAPEEIGGILRRPEAGRGFPIPLAWVNDGLLAVAVSDPQTDRSTITFVDLRYIADPPVAVGQATIGGDVRDGSVRADGNLAVLVRSTGDDPGADIMVIDPVEVTVVERTPLQDGVVAIDFDPAGAHLLVLSETGQLSVAGPSGSVEPLTGSYLDVSW
jgi:hypothetical protein